MKKLALVGALAVAACTPDIPKNAAPKTNVIVAFDPAAAVPVVPSPNDLAINPATGLVNAPIAPDASAAQKEFTQTYLNTLDGFPQETPATALIENGDLDPASVNNTSVLVTDLVTQTPSASTIEYDPTSKQIVVLPPADGWLRGHKYEVAVVSSGSSGVQAQGGGQVFASPVWALARSATPLVQCDSNNVCQSTTSAISDVAQAQQLEQLRLAYVPLLDALASNGVPRDSVAALWTFTVTSHAEVRFDPANSVIPFPNDLVTNPANGHVNLPLPTLPDGGTDTTSLQAQLVTGLNTLDGFSTTAPIVSENSNDGAMLTQGKLDPTSISATTVGFFPIPGGGASTVPNVKPCLLPDMPGCASTTTQPDGSYALPDGGTVPQQFQFVPQAPLDEKASYGSFLTTDLKSSDGKTVLPSTAFVLFRLTNPLVDANGHSTVSGVSDAQAAQIEPARLAMKPFFDGLEAQGLPRSKVALAWTFHTQSEQSILNLLATVPAQAGLPVDPITLVENPALLTCGGTCPYPTANLGHAFDGSMVSVMGITGPGGTLNPDPTHFAPHTIPFILTLPAGTPPAGGWPVVLFGHGLTGNKTQAMAIANSFAQGGFAMLAIDEVWHGERVTCTGVGAFAAALAGASTPLPDGVACVKPGGAPTDPGTCDEGFPVGHCVAGPTATDFGADCTYLSPTNGDTFCKSQVPSQGQCRPTANGQPGPSKCDGSDFKRTGGQPAIGTNGISGWNIFNLSNLFATRDNFRQQVIDNAQAARVIAGGDATDINAQLSLALSAPAKYLDGTKINYVGQSLGGILGTLYTAADKNIHKSVLNVPAGDLLNVFLTSPNSTLAGLRQGFIGTLASQGIPFGTPAFDNFAGIAKWILDPADPVNSGHSLWTGDNVPADRQAFIEFIENDQFLPNPTTEELIAATIRSNMNEKTCADGQTPPCADVFEFTDAQFGAGMPTDPNDRHGFLLNGKGAVTGAAQQQVVQFLATGTVKTTFP